MKKDNALKDFLKTTYSSRSPIPYILSVQVLLFVIIHICDLLVEVNITNYPLYDKLLSTLSLPGDFFRFIQQPWSLVSYPFLYTGLFNILFDCLWIYWLGNVFLNFLNNRQFLTIFISAIFIGGLAYLGLSQIPIIAKNPQAYLHTNAMSIAALMGSLLILVPKLEFRMFLFGNVRFQTIALVFLGLQFIFMFLINKPAALALLVSASWGMLVVYQLRKGNDWSLLFVRKEKTKLRVVRTVNNAPTYKSYKGDLPNQEVIDEILDKISQYGYESLSSREKEILFKVSREEQE